MWALQEPKSEEWVILDSSNFENTDVMPLWSSKELAQKHCSDEWQEYQATAISMSDWFEFWLEDLNDDAVIVGVNWQENDDCLEMDLAEFSLELATVEALK